MSEGDAHSILSRSVSSMHPTDTTCCQNLGPSSSIAGSGLQASIQARIVVPGLQGFAVCWLSSNLQATVRAP